MELCVAEMKDVIEYKKLQKAIAHEQGELDKLLDGGPHPEWLTREETIRITRKAVEDLEALQKETRRQALRSIFDALSRD